MIQCAVRYEVAQDGYTMRVFHASKGYGLPKHQHDYPHLTVCHSGSCAVRMEHKEFVMTKNSQPVNLPANKWHEIEALEDGTVFVNLFSEGKC